MPSDPIARRLLIALCLIEFLERLAGYFVAASLVLYLNDSRHLPIGDATSICGWILGLSYAAAVGGGTLLDCCLGARLATLLGLGVLFLAFCGVHGSPPVPLWLVGGMFVIGNGLFKPGIIALLHKVLPIGHADRSRGFYWFYLAVNGGGVCAPLLGSGALARFGWSGVSSLAAILMACGAAVLLSQWSAVRDAPTVLTAQLDEHRGPRRAVALLIVPLAALAVHCALYVQSMSTLMIWARDCAQRSVMGWSIPPTFFAALPPVVVLVGTPLSSVLMRELASRQRQPSERERIVYGVALGGVAYIPMLLVALLGQETNASPLWLVSCKLLLTVGEMLLLPSALSMVSGIAPGERSGLALGLSFGAQAVGFWIGGELGSTWGQWSQPTFFGVLAGLGLSTAAVLRGTCTTKVRHGTA